MRSRASCTSPTGATSAIQVYDTDLNFKKTITGIGAPWSVQVTAKYIYSGDGNGKIYQLDKNTGKLLGWAQTSLGRGQTGCLIHTCTPSRDNVLYKGDRARCGTWRRSPFRNSSMSGPVSVRTCSIVAWR